MARKNKAQIAEEAAKCYELKLTGASDRQIADVMTAQGHPMTHNTVQNRIKLYLENRIAPGAEEYRKVIIDRAERLILKCEPGIKEGDPRAIANAKSLMDSLYKYHGLDVLKIQDVTERVAPPEELISFYESMLLGDPTAADQVKP